MSSLSGLPRLIDELKRRQVFRLAAVYAVGAWVVVQVVTAIFPVLGLPGWTTRAVVIASILGLPIAVVLAWAFDVSPRGIRRARDDLAPGPEAGAGGPAGEDDLALAESGDRAEMLRAARTAFALLIALVLAGAGGWWMAVSSEAEAANSVAVLPFADLTDRETDDLLGAGITDEIRRHLGGLDGLTVISRTSSLAVRRSGKSVSEIAEELGGVSAVVEGSWQRVGDRVRVTATLVDARKDRQLWSDSYERRLRDIFTIQSDVALQIARALRAELSEKEEERIQEAPTDDLRAWNLYLEGRRHWNTPTPGSLKKAIELFERAVSRDRGFALAHAAKAETYQLLSQVTLEPPAAYWLPVEEAARRALELDSTLAEAHTSLGLKRGLLEWRWTAAEARIRRAIELNPSSSTARLWYSQVLNALGRHEAALAQAGRAAELDPLSPFIRTNHAYRYVFLRGRQGEGISHVRASLELDDDNWVSHWTLGHLYTGMGRDAEALARYERALALSGGGIEPLPDLARAAAAVGDTSRAREVLARLEGRADSSWVPAIFFAKVHFALGHRDEGFRWLERSADERDFRLPFFLRRPSVGPIRSDPRFRSLLERMGLLPAADETAQPASRERAT